MITLELILKTLAFVGTETPAFLQLLNVAKLALSDADQVTLAAAYADARTRSDQQHTAAQA